MAPESFYETHTTSYFVKSRSTVLGTSSYSSKAAHAGFSTGGIFLSRCFSQRASATSHLILVQISFGRRRPPPSLLVARCKACLIFPASTVLWNFRPRDLSYYFPPLVALPYLAAPYTSASPTRPAWRPISQRYILLKIIFLISLSLRTLNILVSITWAKKRGISESQILLITPAIPRPVLL